MTEYKQCNPSLSIRRLCKTFGHVRSSFYAGIKAKRRNDRLDKVVWDQILKIWDEFPGIGYRKLSPKLNCSGKKILRIIRKFRKGPSRMILPKEKPKRRILNVIKLITNDLKKYGDKCKRGNWILREGKNKYRHIIDPTRPYQLWAGDWKELKIPLLGVTLYIFTIIDCYTRQLMGWELSLIKDPASAIKAADMAVSKAKKDPIYILRKLIMHTDQGGAYISDEYIEYWRSHGVILSTSDRGKPTQNPYAEAFFSILSRFWLKYKEILTVTDAKNVVSEFFSIYNSQWSHSGIDHMTPDQKLKQFHLSL